MSTGDNPTEETGRPTMLIPEIWVSGQNREEVHLFVEGTCGEYVLGFNPKIVPIKEVRELLEQKGFKFNLDGKI